MFSRSSTSTRVRDAAYGRAVRALVTIILGGIWLLNQDRDDEEDDDGDDYDADDEEED